MPKHNLDKIKWDEKIKALDKQGNVRSRLLRAGEYVGVTPYFLKLQLLGGECMAILNGHGYPANFSISGGLSIVIPSIIRPSRYKVSVNGSEIIFVRSKRDNNLNYFDLKLSGLSQLLGGHVDGVFVPYNGSPFYLYGFLSKHPVCFAFEIENKLLLRGLFARDGEVTVFNWDSLASEEVIIREFLDMPKKLIFAASDAPVEKLGAVVEAKPVKIEVAKPSVEADVDWMVPKSIVNYLDNFVVGQDHAKKIVAVSFSNYMIKKLNKDAGIAKQNVLLIGPSGVGKTYLISLLAQKAKLPMANTKVTGKSAEGYAGENLSNVFQSIKLQTDDSEPFGIVFFDEIDKIGQSTLNRSFGGALQDELIGWLEDAMLRGDSRNRNNLNMSTKNLLFVTAGAFQGNSGMLSLNDIIETRLGRREVKIGFITETPNEENGKYDVKKVFESVKPEDLVEYGLKPELVGRLPAIGILNALTLEDKVKILTDTKNNCIETYQKLLQAKGYSLEIDSEVYNFIARKCPDETGARGLQSLANELFTEIIYDPTKYAEGNIINVNEEMAYETIKLYS